MASNKTKTTAAETTAAETTAAETAAAETAAEKKVKIRIPLTRTDTADVYVSVNDRSWLIKRGEEVEVPECVAEVLRNQETALGVAYAYSAAAESK